MTGELRPYAVRVRRMYDGTPTTPPDDVPRDSWRYYVNVGHICAAESPEQAIAMCAEACGFESVEAMRHHDEPYGGVPHLVDELPAPTSHEQLITLFNHEDADPAMARELATALCVAAWDDTTPAELVPVRVQGEVFNLCEGRYRDGVNDPYWVCYDEAPAPEEEGSRGRP